MPKRACNAKKFLKNETVLKFEWLYELKIQLNISFNSCIFFFTIIVASFLSFKIQTHVLELTTSYQKLIALRGCRYSYNFNRPVKSLHFRLTSGQTSSEKIFTFLLAQKNRRHISGGLLGGPFDIWLHLLVEKLKNTLLSFQRQKRRNCELSKNTVKN